MGDNFRIHHGLLLAPRRRDVSSYRSQLLGMKQQLQLAERSRDVERLCRNKLSQAKTIEQVLRASREVLEQNLLR
jgi:hypothetical protein